MALFAVGLVLWPLVLVLPGVSRRWWVLHRGLRLMAAAGGIGLSIEGRPPEGPAVLVLNHESYLDGAILIAASHQPLEIAVGAVLEHQKVPGPFLRRIGCLFVGSDDEPGRSQLERLTRAAARGHLALFPEGHLVREEALGRLHLGAFVAAANAGVAVVPAAIVGSRRVLPPGGRRARPGGVTLRYGSAITAEGSGFRAARRLAAAVEEALGELRGPVGS